MDRLLPALASDPEMATAHALFLCGPVPTPAFLTGLLEHPVAGLEARLEGFRLVDPATLSGTILLTSPGDSVSGLLYRGLTGEDFRRVDGYHGVGEGLYRRVLQKVERAGQGRERETESTWVYLPTERTLDRCH